MLQMREGWSVKAARGGAVSYYDGQSAVNTTHCRLCAPIFSVTLTV